MDSHPEVVTSLPSFLQFLFLMVTGHREGTERHGSGVCSHTEGTQPYGWHIRHEFDISGRRPGSCHGHSSPDASNSRLQISQTVTPLPCPQPGGTMRFLHPSLFKNVISGLHYYHLPARLSSKLLLPNLLMSVSSMGL